MGGNTSLNPLDLRLKQFSVCYNFLPIECFQVHTDVLKSRLFPWSLSFNCRGKVHPGRSRASSAFRARHPQGARQTQPLSSSPPGHRPHPPAAALHPWVGETESLQPPWVEVHPSANTYWAPTVCLYQAPHFLSTGNTVPDKTESVLALKEVTRSWEGTDSSPMIPKLIKFNEEK